MNAIFTPMGTGVHITVNVQAKETVKGSEFSRIEARQWKFEGNALDGEPKHGILSFKSGNSLGLIKFVGDIQSLSGIEVTGIGQLLYFQLDKPKLDYIVVDEGIVVNSKLCSRHKSMECEGFRAVYRAIYEDYHSQKLQSEKKKSKKVNAEDEDNEDNEVVETKTVNEGVSSLRLGEVTMTERGTFAAGLLNGKGVRESSLGYICGYFLNGQPQYDCKTYMEEVFNFINDLGLKDQTKEGLQSQPRGFMEANTLAMSRHLTIELGQQDGQEMQEMKKQPTTSKTVQNLEQSSKQTDQNRQVKQKMHSKKYLLYKKRKYENGIDQEISDSSNSQLPEGLSVELLEQALSAIQQNDFLGQRDDGNALEGDVDVGSEELIELKVKQEVIKEDGLLLVKDVQSKK